MPYPFANFPNQCSYGEYIYLHVSNLSFQGKNGVDLEAAHSKDRWKRRRHRKLTNKWLVYSLVGKGSDLSPYYYFFVFSRIIDNAQNKCGGCILCILFSFILLLSFSVFLKKFQNFSFLVVFVLVLG